MRVLVALSLVLLGLIVLTVRVATRRPRHAAIVEADDPDPVVRSPPARVIPARSAPPPPPARRERVGVARLVGHVLPPPGETAPDALSDLSVVADDGTRTFEGRVLSGGRFAFHLPAGRYTLTASAGALVGTELGVIARADAERAVEIRLGAGATIKGSFRAPDGATVVVAARFAGATTQAGVVEMGDGTFTIAGLVAGRRYDLTFLGDDVRTATLEGVVAPADGEDVTLEPLATVRGAIGFARGGLCPIDEVKLQLPGTHRPADGAPGVDADEGATIAQPERDCRFELTVPDGVTEATVVATGPGWYLEEGIQIPDHGSPEDVCLNPPCREDPMEGSARLRVAIAGGDAGSAIAARATVDDEGASSSFGCRSTRGWCVMEALPVGRPIEVRGEIRAEVRGAGSVCRADPQTMTLVAGDNFVSLDCRRPL